MLAGPIRGREASAKWIYGGEGIERGVYYVVVATEVMTVTCTLSDDRGVLWRYGLGLVFNFISVWEHCRTTIGCGAYAALYGVWAQRIYM